MLYDEGAAMEQALDQSAMNAYKPSNISTAADLWNREKRRMSSARFLSLYIAEGDPMTENRFKNLALEALGCFVSALGVYSFAVAAQVPIDGIAGVGANFVPPVRDAHRLVQHPAQRAHCAVLLQAARARLFPAQRALHGDVRLLYRLCPAHAAVLHRRPPARRRLRRRGHGHWRRADLYAEFQHRRRRFHHNGHQGQAPAPAVRQPDLRCGAGRDPGQSASFSATSTPSSTA